MRSRILIKAYAVVLMVGGPGALAAQDAAVGGVNAAMGPVQVTRPAFANRGWSEGLRPAVSVTANHDVSSVGVAGVSAMSRRSPRKRALVGGLIGAAAGAVFGSIAPASCCVPFGWSRAEAVALWSAGGAVAGAVVGLVVRPASDTPASAASIGTHHPARTLVGVRIPVAVPGRAPR